MTLDQRSGSKAMTVVICPHIDRELMMCNLIDQCNDVPSGPALYAGCKACNQASMCAVESDDRMALARQSPL